MSLARATCLDDQWQMGVLFIYLFITFYFSKPFIIILEILPADTSGKKITHFTFGANKDTSYKYCLNKYLTPHVPPWCGSYLCPHGHRRLLSILKPDHTVLGNVKQTSEGLEVDVNHREIAG